MKKFMFSAVALVAFSFAGMANNEVKEVETNVVKIKKAEVVEVVRLDPCMEKAFAWLDLYESVYGELDFAGQTDLVNGIYASCMGY